MSLFIQTYGGTLLAIAGTLFGTWCGYKLKAWDEEKNKLRRIGATWGAISAEVEACRRMATEYLTPNDKGQRVFAPLWRLPNVMLTSSLRALLADGDPTEVEVDALLKFHNEVETLNRGLDLTQETSGHNNRMQQKLNTDLPAMVKAVVNSQAATELMARNDMKAKRLIEGGEFYAALRPLIDKHVPRSIREA